MDWREEKAQVAGALDSLLPTLTHPHLTMALGFRLSGITGIPEPRCRKILGWLATGGHPHATHDGGIFRSYGRDVVRWRWHPVAQRAAKVGPVVAPAPVAQRLPISKLETMLIEAGVIDTSEW